MTQTGGSRIVLVVGSVNVDTVMTVPRLPAKGETVGGASYARYHGGKGANQAVAARRLGARVAFVGAVGRDENGADSVRALEVEGIDCRGVARRPIHTGIASILIDQAGDNIIVVAPGANERIDLGWMHHVLATEPPGVLLTCFEIPTAVVAEATRAAHAAGWEVIVDPAPAEPAVGWQWLPSIVLTPNEHELSLLSGSDDPVVGARSLARHSRGPVVATLGSRGALLTYPDGSHQWYAPPDVDVRDTTGAGDAFNGALAALRARGVPLEEAVRQAVIAASLATRQTGAREGLVRIGDLPSLTLSDQAPAAAEYRQDQGAAYD